MLIPTVIVVEVNDEGLVFVTSGPYLKAFLR